MKPERTVFFANLFATALLALSILGFWFAFQNTPAANTDLRRENVAGQWRIGNSNAMFNSAEYMFQIGQSYLSSGMLVQDDGAIGAENFSLDNELENMAKAETHLKDSLDQRPGNAHAWTALAWVYSSTGNDDAMYSALEKSWQTAPNNLQLSIDRLLMIETIASFSEENAKANLLANYANHISTDLLVAQTFAARNLKEILEFSPFLAEHSPRLGLQQ